MKERKLDVAGRLGRSWVEPLAYTIAAYLFADVMGLRGT
jgi:hypothetical protein